MSEQWLERLEPPITDVVDVDSGERLAVAVWPGAGETFVFAPGLTSTSRNIAGVAAMLDGAHTVVAVDLRGRGNSTKPAAGSYGMAAHAADIVSVMDGVGVERAFVGGHSMGAYVATAVSVRAPDRCRGVVLIDGGVALQIPGLPDPDTMLDMLLAPVMERLGRTFPSLDAYRDHLTESDYFELSPIAELYLRYDLGVAATGLRPKCIRDAAVEDWRDLLANPETVERLNHISRPVLAVRAEHGIGPGQPPILGDLHVGLLKDAVSDVELVFVPGTTHHSITLSEKGALATADALTAFIDRVA